MYTTSSSDALQALKVSASFAIACQPDRRDSVLHLPNRDEFHPKRNQARQKLSTLAKPRFKDLASDVFFELGRRYPEFKEPEVRLSSLHELNLWLDIGYRCCQIPQDQPMRKTCQVQTIARRLPFDLSAVV
jgi:Spa2 homology domain (SHD) of GIT